MTPNAALNSECPPTQWIACDGWFSERAHKGPAWLKIEAGLITEIASTAPRGAPVARENVDRLYLLPLLADTHVHVYMEPWPVDPAKRRPPGGDEFEIEVCRAMRRVDQALSEGIGLLRDMGDPHGINLEVKRRLAGRGGPAPELLVAGPGFHRPKKYGRYLGVAHDNVASILAAIDQLHRQREIDFIKVVTTGIVDFTEQRVKQAPQYTIEELTAVVDHAHKLGYQVASHCSGPEGIDINLAAGVDFIEHAYFVREDQVDRMAANGTRWTPTLAPVYAQTFHRETGWPEAVRQSIAAILDEHAVRIAYGRSRGASVLAGTDAGSPGVGMGAGLRIELERLATAGIAPEQLLQTATVGNAAAVGAKFYSPTLRVGGPASFALYRKCPWEDIRHLDTLRHVYVRGHRVPPHSHS